MIETAPSARVSPLADVEDSLRGSRIIFREGVVIDSFVKIKPAGGTGDVDIGENSIINSGCVLYSGNGIHIGRNVAIAANCTLAPTNHEYRSRLQPIRNQGFRTSKGGILIEDDVWIGASCVLLDGTIIREGCVIAAGTVVRGEIPPYTIAGGNPLRILGRRGTDHE